MAEAAGEPTPLPPAVPSGPAPSGPVPAGDSPRRAAAAPDREPMWDEHALGWTKDDAIWAGDPANWPDDSAAWPDGVELLSDDEPPTPEAILIAFDPDIAPPSPSDSWLPGPDELAESAAAADPVSSQDTGAASADPFHLDEAADPERAPNAATRPAEPYPL